ncbi:MAG TPA: transcriptional regulator [Asticcacaulis sp.]|nr:transcriptional regulator [Asticcacaulis sp.]
MAAPDEFIHQPLRLKIMAALYAARAGDPLVFTQLKTITQATDGNLGAHLTALEKVGYIAIDKDFVGKKPRTQLSLTPVGSTAFRQHVAYLRELVETVEDEGRK